VVGYAATGTVDAVAPGGALVPVGDAEGLGRALVAAITRDGTIPSVDGALWVLARFDRTSLWATLAERYRSALT
jgi:hypothetical protein